MHHTLVEKLGEGGMGVVWRARDRKLDREVAIKILPAAFSADPGRRARFEREARLLAALSHPNIATIHGLERDGEVRFLVMELVPGPDLADRLAHGPLDPAEALDAARQIAEALDAAHERGIIHRDLKPANVKLTPGGKVKVLDFGLAKALEADPRADPELSPTVTSAGTRVGEILGTASYMSPEQARGLPLDRRTDIWSFGCVLFEMLAGEAPFRRATVPETLAALLEREPDWSRLPPATPDAVTRLLRRCLAKKPDSRLRDIGDALLEIDDIVAGAPSADPASPAAARGGVPYWAAALLLLLGGATGALLVPRGEQGSSPASTPLATRLSVTLPPSVVIDVGARPALAVSPDGRRLAFTGREDDRKGIWLRPLDADEAVAVPDTDGADAPFFSSDGRWLGLLQGNLLRKSPAGGGPPVSIASIPPVARGFDWDRPDRIVMSPAKITGLWSIGSDGGEASLLTEPDAESGELNHCWPQTVHDGSEALVTVLRQSDASYDDADVVRIDLETGERTSLVTGGYYGRLLGGRILSFVRDGKLWAAPVDPDTLEPRRPAVEVLDGFLTDPGTGAASFGVARDGTLAYVPGGVHEWQRGRLVWVDRQGRAERVSDDLKSFRYPRVSPDGRRLSFTIEEASDDVWVFDLDRGGFTRLTFENRDIAPIWRPGHDELSFSSVAPGGHNPDLYRMTADGSGKPQALVSGGGRATFNCSWSPDGETLLIMMYRGDFDVLASGSGGTGTPNPVLDSRFNETMATFSPDGRWIAYASDESGRMEVYVQPYPGPGGKTKVSTGGGGEPVWNPRGGELFYRNGDRMMSVTIRTDPVLRVSRPELLFDEPFARRTLAWITNYDIDRDGRRFLMIQEEERLEIREIRVVLHWLDEVERLLAASD